MNFPTVGPHVQYVPSFNTPHQGGSSYSTSTSLCRHNSEAPPECGGLQSGFNRGDVDYAAEAV